MANTLRCSRSYQRLIVRCVLAAALIAAIFCFGSTWPPVASADGTKNGHHLSRESPNHQERLTEDKAIEQADVPKVPSSPKAEVEVTPPARAPPKEPVVTVSDHQWTESIHRIEDLLDDELRLKALLAPITDTGEPLLRDLTHRVRAFRNVFKTWEELHIDPNDGRPGHIIESNVVCNSNIF
jgi:hypothetical protein